MKKKILLISILAVSFLLPSLVFAGGNRSMPRDGWWRRPQIAEIIKLTDEEKNQLEAKYVESQRKRLDMKAEVRKEQFELDVLLDKKVSDKEIMAQYAKMADARAKLSEEMFKFILETRNVIGAERFKQIKDLAKEWRRNRSKDWGQDPRSSMSRPNTPQAMPQTMPMNKQAPSQQ